MYLPQNILDNNTTPRLSLDTFFFFLPGCTRSQSKARLGNRTPDILFPTFTFKFIIDMLEYLLWKRCFKNRTVIQSSRFRPDVSLLPVRFYSGCFWASNSVTFIRCRSPCSLFVRFVSSSDSARKSFRRRRNTKKKKSIGERKLHVAARLARQSGIGKRRPTFVPPPARPSPTRPPTNVPTCSVHNHPPSHRLIVCDSRKTCLGPHDRRDRCTGSVYFRVDDSTILYTIRTRIVKITPAAQCNSRALRAFGHRMGNFWFYQRY